VIAAATAALALALAAAADPQAQIAAARARRAAEQAAARALAEKETSVLGLVDAAQRARADAEREAARAEAERARAEAALAAARAEEAGAAARRDAAIDRLRPRLAARARMGRLGGVRLLLASGSLSDLSRRRYALDRVLERDAALLREARGLHAEEEAARRAQEAEAARLGALVDEAARRRAEAAEKAEESRAVLAAVRGERALHERAAAEAAAQERKLGQLVASLSPAPPPVERPAAPVAAGFAALRGRLPRPAEGPVVTPFGRVVDPRFNTVTSHPGVDIRAPRGAPVRAVAPGRVVHAGWFRGYGNLVIVEHGDGYHTLVAHLGSMSTAVGEDVDRGSVLGSAGEEGAAGGEGVYFEIRERQRPVDPAGWLARAAGDVRR
jgi:murein DD-endopeptidase MepM/ murein hydrolase activator NlpD